jgi:hypothetical protein
MKKFVQHFFYVFNMFYGRWIGDHRSASVGSGGDHEERRRTDSLSLVCEIKKEMRRGSQKLQTEKKHLVGDRPFAGLRTGDRKLDTPYL